MHYLIGMFIVMMMFARFPKFMTTISILGGIILAAGIASSQHPW